MRKPAIPAALITSSHGYIDDNISAFSSGGFAQTRARTIDAVAPGGVGMGASVPLICRYMGSVLTDAGTATPIVPFAGTRANPRTLVAGEAVLIIQAYRSTHCGSGAPLPALIKTIKSEPRCRPVRPRLRQQGRGLIDSAGSPCTWPHGRLFR